MKRSFWFWGAIPAALAVLALWYPFGFSMGGILEEWDMLYVLDHHPHMWNSFPGNPMSDVFAARPLQILPFAIARLISGNSFAGFHVVLMLACFVRIIAGCSLGYFLFRNRLFALALGLMFLLYPADTQQMAFRTLNVSSAVALICAGTALAIDGIVRKRSTSITLSIAASVIATWIYEPVLTLYALAPAVIFARYGVRRSLHLIARRRRLISAWCVGPAINAAYLYYAIAIARSGYQVESTEGGALPSLVKNLHYLIDSAAYRIFFDSWRSAWEIFTSDVAHYGYMAVCAVVLLIALATSANRRRPATAVHLRVIALGLLCIVAGYLPFMVAESHMVVAQRTFMGTAPGSALILVALATLLLRGRLAAVGLAAVASLALVAQLYQFDQYTRTYVDVVRPYTSLLAERTDPSKKVHLVFDDSGYGGYLMGAYSSKVAYSASVRDGRDTGLSVLCLDQPLSVLTPYSNCSLENGKWTVRGPSGTTATFPEERVQVIRIGRQFDDAYRESVRTWHDLGGFDERKSMFKSAGNAGYSCDIDSMWGYSRFCRGLGWSDGIYRKTGWNTTNFIASIAPSSTFIFDLNPLAADYILSMRVYGGMDGAITKNVSVSVNGRPVDFRVEPSGIFATVPRPALKEGLNEIRLDGVLPTGRDIGLLVSRVTLEPSAARASAVMRAEHGQDAVTN